MHVTEQMIQKNIFKSFFVFFFVFFHLPFGCPTHNFGPILRGQLHSPMLITAFHLFWMQRLLEPSKQGWIPKTGQVPNRVSTRKLLNQLQRLNPLSHYDWQHLNNKSVLNSSHPNPRQREKINLNVYF